ncbi:4'-phosphopantetheinyl transferase superfamily protein [Butyrivibrio sp. X503]|uniref:4'-phosphopantetheinyl transferase family protein n=1 Tax=Butyrivibrio sp. X503 TaxID=2364878 RepID=UPI000EAA879B|nr:4'-phosphopantetheinyl transferase superfamily protein [Butyrivibrio sp. X503]RKM56473.1 4'-phosphopantetheinyl transferase superfamily protein [Butyrivibrio sp. X503]
MMQVYVLDALKEFSDKRFEEALKYVDEAQRDKILRFHFDADKKRSLAGLLLSYYAIFKEFGLAPKDITFDKNKYGKPFVKDRDDIYYNISHSGNYVVCAIGSSPVGIDVQEHKNADLNIADRFFSKEEKEALATVGNKGAETEEEILKKRKKLFYDMWSLKEAYIKCIGIGLSKPLNEFGIVSEDGLYKLFEDGVMSDDYFFKKYDIAENYSLCACSKDDSFPENFSQLGYSAIIDAYH